MKEHTVSCLNLEQIQVTTVCRQFSEFIHVAGPPKVIQAVGIELYFFFQGYKNKLPNILFGRERPNKSTPTTGQR